MLLEIRDRASGIVAYFIVGLLVISFALWGIQEYFGTGEEPLVAEVGDLEVTQREFNRRLQEQSRYLRSVLGNSYDTVYPDEGVLKQEVLDGLIENAVLQQKTDSMGFRVNDYEVLQYLQALPYFQNNGRFDVNRYEQVLSSQGLSAERFEQQLRQDQAINQFRTSIRVSSFLTPAERLQLASINEQKRSFSFIKTMLAPDSIEVSDQDIDAYYQKNQKAFLKPAQVKLEYLQIDQNSIAEGYTLSDEDLRVEYESNPERFRSKELRQVRRILLKLDDTADAGTVQKKQDELASIQKRIEDGEDFATLAAEYSEDKFSAERGGDLGLISAEDFDDPEFNKAAFSLQKGQVSSPVRTRFGVQLIQVTDIQSGTQQQFDEAKDEIENELRQNYAQKEYFQLAEELDHLTYENDDNLNVAADELDLEIQQTDWLSDQSEDDLMQVKAIREAAFSDDLVQRGLNSTVIEPGDGRALVIRVSAYQKEEPRPLEEVRDEVRRMIKKEKAREENQQQVELWLTKLRDGQIDLGQIAKQQNVQLETSGLVLRDDAKVPSMILSQAFRMGENTDGSSSFDLVEMENGAFALVRLDEVVEQEVSASAIEAGEWSVYSTQYGRREMEAVVGTILDNVDMRLYPENL